MPRRSGRATSLRLVRHLVRRAAHDGPVRAPAARAQVPSPCWRRSVWNAPSPRDRVVPFGQAPLGSERRRTPASRSLTLRRAVDATAPSRTVELARRARRRCRACWLVHRPGAGVDAGSTHAVERPERVTSCCSGASSRPRCARGRASAGRPEDGRSIPQESTRCSQRCPRASASANVAAARSTGAHVTRPASTIQPRSAARRRGPAAARPGTVIAEPQRCEDRAPVVVETRLLTPTRRATGCLPDDDDRARQLLGVARPADRARARSARHLPAPLGARRSPAGCGAPSSLVQAVCLCVRSGATCAATTGRR